MFFYNIVMHFYYPFLVSLSLFLYIAQLNWISFHCPSGQRYIFTPILSVSFFLPPHSTCPRPYHHPTKPSIYRTILYTFSFNQSFIRYSLHLIIQQISTEHILCVRSPDENHRQRITKYSPSLKELVINQDKYSLAENVASSKYGMLRKQKGWAFHFIETGKSLYIHIFFPKVKTLIIHIINFKKLLKLFKI